jgi:hypothetical protein
MAEGDVDGVGVVGDKGSLRVVCCEANLHGEDVNTEILELCSRMTPHLFVEVMTTFAEATVQELPTPAFSGD